jgi:hypothetical protein
LLHWSNTETGANQAISLEKMAQLMAQEVGLRIQFPLCCLMVSLCLLPKQFEAQVAGPAVLEQNGCTR